MKSFTSIFSLFCFAILCFATAKLNAQVNQMSSSYTTSVEFENGATSGLGSTVVVAVQRPTLQVRLSSFNVNNGVVTHKSGLDLTTSANKVNVAMLTGTMVALAQISTTNKLVVSIYDISANGSFTHKNTWNGPTVKDEKPGIVRLTNGSFATATVLGSGYLRISTYTVNGNNIIVKQDDDDDNTTTVQAVDLARMSSTRIVAGERIANDQMKLITFDVNETTNVISRRGDRLLSGSVKKISMVSTANNRLVAFSTDNNDRLDAAAFELTNSGSYVLKNKLEDIIKPNSNGQYFTIRALDGQSLGTNGKILLSSIRTSEQLSVIPFTVNSAGLVSHNTGDYSPNSPYFTRTYATVIGGKLVTANRKMDNKYVVRCYNWN
jgi:hypothetical protein